MSWAILSTAAMLAASLGAGGAWLAYQHGLEVGRTKVEAAHSQQQLQRLDDVLQAQQSLVRQANLASAAMRSATAARQQADEKSTQEFADALSRTAGSRTGCHLDAGLLRQLATARDRAAQAAAHGLRPALPAASGLEP